METNQSQMNQEYQQESQLSSQSNNQSSSQQESSLQSSQSNSLIEFTDSLGNVFSVPAAPTEGQEQAAPEIEQIPAPEPAPVPVPEPIVPDFQYDVNQIEAWKAKATQYEQWENNAQAQTLLKTLMEDPAQAAEMAGVLTSDYNNADPFDLYREGWMQKHAFQGVSYSQLNDAFEEHISEDLFGFDSSEPEFGLTGRKLLQFRQEVEMTRATKIKQQAEFRDALTQFQGPQNNQGYSDTPEQRAEVAKYYQDEIARVNIDYKGLGLPAEVANLLDPALASSYKASMIEQVGEKPLLGLERFFIKTANGSEALDVQKLSQSMFMVDNFQTIIDKAIAQGMSKGRADMAKELEGKINQPGPGHTPGGSSQTPNMIRMSDGTLVPMA